MSRRVEVDVEQHPDHLLVRWSTPNRSGEGRFDRLDQTVPRWLGGADDLLEGADRRTSDAVLDRLAAWAVESGETLGIWRDDEGIELLTIT